MNETQYINDKWKYLSENSKDLPLEAFFGLEFPGGNFFIDRETNILVNKSTGVKLDNDNLNNLLYAHPIYFMIITLRGSGVSIQDIFNLLNYDTKNGPMLGQCNMEFKSQLKIDQEYFVKGRINSLISKESSKLGRIKILDFSLSLYKHISQEVGHVKYVWILPLDKKDEL